MHLPQNTRMQTESVDERRSLINEARMRGFTMPLPEVARIAGLLTRMNTDDDDKSFGNGMWGHRFRNIRTELPESGYDP